MTQSIEHLRAQRRERAKAREAEALRYELASIGATAAQAHIDPSEEGETALKGMIDSFIERVGR